MNQVAVFLFILLVMGLIVLLFWLDPFRTLILAALLAAIAFAWVLSKMIVERVSI